MWPAIIVMLILGNIFLISEIRRLSSGFLEPLAA